MKIRKLTLALAVAFAFGAGSAHAATDIQWWHSMTGALGDRVNEIATKFNASQSDYKVVPVYKGAMRFDDRGCRRFRWARPRIFCRCSKSAPPP